MNHQCEGKCDGMHTGDVLRVTVNHNAGPGEYNWGEFWYCLNARQEDRRRGFIVEPVREAQK